MAIGDLENTLEGRLATQIGHYSSAWWDMRHAAQIMHTRSELGKDPAHYFARRGLLDGAVITYARCFADGTRTPQAKIRPLLDALTDDELAVHKTALWWRDKHVGHRVDKRLETISAHLLWGNFGVNAPTIRVRLMTRVIPELADFQAGFEALAQRLAERIWEEHLYPLQQELFAELGTDTMLKLKQSAQPYHESPYPIGTIGVATDIGSIPPVPSD
jgi:hypothetical protein